MSRHSQLLICLLLGILAPPAYGESILDASTADAASSFRTDTGQYSTAQQNNENLFVGREGTGGVVHRSAVFPFQLPDFGPVAEPFEIAEFIFELTGTQNASGFNADLYGLEARASSAVLPTSVNTTNPGDFFMGGLNGSPADDTSPGVTKIQDNILASGTAIGTVTTNFIANNQLAAYLNAEYDGGNGAGKWVFLRLNTDSVPSGASRYVVAAANNTNANIRPRIRYNFEFDPPRARPFMWVTDEEKPDILAKIADHAWAASLFNQLVARTAAAVASHQADRDAYIRGLPVSWNLSPARYRTTNTTGGATYLEIRSTSEEMFNTALDAAILHYLTGETQYAELAGDVLHNVARTLMPVTPSSDLIPGGWIIQNDFLLESRVLGNPLPIIYDFLHDYLMENPVHDVQTGGLATFAFSDAQGVFRQYYQLARDRGLLAHSNWSALMSTAMLNNLLAFDDAGERDAALNVYLTTGTDRQDSMAQDYQLFTQTGNLWPESTQYIADVIRIRSSQLPLLDRYDPSLNALATYANFPLALPRVTEFRYPNGSLICFGDGGRTVANSEPVAVYDIIYSQAVASGNTELAGIMGGWINAAIEAGIYNRASLPGYSSLGRNDEPLKLLWGQPEIPEPPVPASRSPRTDRLPFAGITLQRNPAPQNNRDFGLMGFVGGAGYIHSHASGMNIELYGLGQVLGAKGGSDSNRGSLLHRRYYRTFAGHNTIIVNGGSRGSGGWEGIEINTVQNVSMEPQAFATAVSPNHSFSVSSFNDNKGNLSNATQQRTLALVRTSPTSGFYVDFFRSDSPVTNRTAVTLDGQVTDQYHDYIYRNIGELDPEVLVDGMPASLSPQSGRFQNDIGDFYQQPGWRYFENTRVTHPTNQAMRARFTANIGGAQRCMTLHMPAIATREIAMVESPPIADAPGPYANAKSPTLVIRQIGEAWDKPFAAVFEPHFNEDGNSVQNVTHLERGGVVVGVKVESLIDGMAATHYVISNPGASQTYQDATVGLSFTGRFGIVADLGDEQISLYLGAGSSMTYRGRSISTNHGGNSQAEARFAPGVDVDVTANTAVAIIETSMPTVSTVADRTMTSAMAPLEIPFTVNDEAVPPGELVVTADSTNSLLFPAGSLVVSGSGAERVLSITPASGIFGTATITITASKDTAFGGSSFEITVESGANFFDVLPSLAQDAMVQSNFAAISQTAASGQVGTAGPADNRYDRGTVFVFQLPDFGAVENPFVEASFSFNLEEKFQQPERSDLYALAVRSSPTVLGSDYYGQTTTPDPTPGTVRIQETILDNSSPLGIRATSTSAGIALTDYLNAAYDSGAGAGKYAFLRINSTIPIGDVRRFIITFSEGGNAGPPDTRPHISFAAVIPDGPTVSTPENVSVPVGTAIAPIEVTLGGGATSLVATSSNPALLADTGIAISGAGNERTLALSPAPNSLGTTTITLTAGDGSETATTTFMLEFTGDAIQRWRFANFGTTAAEGDAAPHANPDGDAFDNAAEYTLGTDPNLPSIEPLLKLHTNGEARSLEFFAIAAEGTGYEAQTRLYTIEFSDDLSKWDDLPNATAIIGENASVSIELPATPDLGFYRLKVWLD